MSFSLTADGNDVDPRIRRTRKMLQDALAKLLKKKEFENISIGDIAEESTLNRATFYDHYTDKFALLECLVASQFQELIVTRNIRFDACEGTLKSIATGVCYYLAEMIRPGRQGIRQASTPMATAVVSVVRQVILDGFGQHPPKPEISPEILSSTIAWAIYGAAKEWVQTPDRVPETEIAKTIEKTIVPILVSLG
jgi:AcrR family transcriptional regulator